MTGAHARAAGGPRRAKTARTLWSSLRKNIPAYVGSPLRRRFYRPRVPRFRINPETTAKRVWDLLLAVFVLYTTCVVPYRVCFRRDAKGVFAALEHVMDIAFGVDIVLNFFTGIYLPSGEISYSMRAIARAYVRGWFLVDFFSTMQFELFASESTEGGDSNALMSTKLLRSLKVLKLFKLARVRRLGQMFSSLEDAVSTNQSAVSLVKLALSMFFFAHIVACVWYAIGSQNESESWIIGMQYDEMHLADEDLLRYLSSMYWAIVTMATIGYGDIVATNNEERLVNIAVMAIGVSFFGYVMGTISTLVTNLNVSAALYEKRMTTVKEYIFSRQIPKHMGKKIRDHFEYYYLNHSVFQERKILARLPSALRNELIHHVYAKLVANVKYFSKCHESLVSDIVMLMHPCSVLKNEFVYVQHEIAAHVFFLLKGKIRVSRTLPGSNGEVKIGSHTVGEHFGEMEVYDHGNGVRMCSAVAKSFCELTFLSRESILKLSERWPEVIQHFRESARESSNQLRRHAGFPAADGDMYSIFRERETVTAMIRSSMLVKKSTQAVPSSRISPFVNEDTGLEMPGAASELLHHRIFSTRSTRSPRHDLPLAQYEDAADGDADAANNSQPGTPPPLVSRQPAASLYMSVEKPTEAVVVAVSESLPLVISPKSTKKMALFARQASIPFADLQSDCLVHKSDAGGDGDERDAEWTHRNAAASESNPAVAANGSHTAAAVLTNEATSELQSPRIQPPPQSQTPPLPRLEQKRYSLLSLSRSMTVRDLQSMVEKFRNPTATPLAQQNVVAELLLLKGTYVFHPQEPFIVSWQFVVGLAILYSIVVVPLRLGFSYDAVGGWFALELIIDGFFFFDILISFRTAYVNDEKLLIHDARAIRRKYVRGWFLPDLVSTIPFDDLVSLFMGASSEQVHLFPTKLLRLTRVARLLKLTRFVKLSRVFGKIRDIVQLSPWAERLWRLLFMMSLFCHWNACLFHASMLMSEGEKLPNWCAASFSYTRPNFVSCSESVPLADRYVASMYWAFTTLTTVGYGDIRPSVYSVYELALVIALIVVNATFFGYIVSSVMDLIQNYDPSDREYKLLMTEMKDYMRESSATARLSSIVKVHYKHNVTCTSLFPEKKIFDKLAPSLRFDIARLVAGETLFAIPLITVMEDAFKGFVSYALFQFKPMCIVRSEKVCRCGGPGTEMFFLVEGECDLVNSRTNAGRVIGENSVFEQYALMAKPEEVYRTVSTVTALTAKCVLYSFSIQDLRDLEAVSPAVSTYFLSQLAAVLIEDALFELSAAQQANVEHALRCGRAFHSVAEHHQRTQLNTLGKVALAKLYPRRGSEWSPDLLPRQLQRIKDTDARGTASASARLETAAISPPLESVTSPPSPSQDASQLLHEGGSKVLPIRGDEDERGDSDDDDEDPAREARSSR